MVLWRSFGVTLKIPLSCSKYSTKKSLHILERAVKYGKRPAIYANGEEFTYRDLLDGSASIAKWIHPGERVAFLCARDETYTFAQWGIWRAGAVAVPLHPEYPIEELEYVIQDSQSTCVLTHPGGVDKVKGIVQKLGLRMSIIDSSSRLHESLKTNHWKCPTNSSLKEPSSLARDHHDFPLLDMDKEAMILYTSGTTGKPKGVVTTHRILSHQIQDLVQAWEWTKEDRILHFLPLHHTHGILNKLLCSLWVGATCEFSPSANPSLLWKRLALPSSERPPLSLFMAVPTIYMKMLEELDKMNPKEIQQAIHGTRKLRVAISGSMACPKSIHHRWKKLTGLTLLERYGMTEIGMALSNPLHGERHPGFVGQPLPSVQVCIVDPNSHLLVPSGEVGELRIKGPTVFKEYWNRAKATEEAFDHNGWFKTGDIARFDVDLKSYQICGRASADIIKSGGYKISALDIEGVLLEHPLIAEAVVLGVPNETYGETVVAILRLHDNMSLMDDQVVEFVSQHLAHYKVPRMIKYVQDIPKNAMGKVNKIQLRQQFFPSV